MSWMEKRMWRVFGFWLLLMASMRLQGQVSTTTVADTIYRADGTLATGTVIVSWPAFTTAGGQAVPGGSTSAPIATGGVFSIQLAPNAGATPAGTFYTAVYHLDNGSVSREYWTVPVSQAAVTVSAVRSTVLPASVAIQTASKSYVDTAIAAALTGAAPGASVPYVAKGGDTMSGPLALPGDPTSGAQAADKHYVDAAVGAVNSGLAQKVSTAPQATQVVTQPSGTQLETNLLNGVEYASQYVNGFGNNGISTAVNAPDCASGCEVKTEQSYNSGEGYSPSSWHYGLTQGTHMEDDRGGERHASYFNPVNFLNAGNDAGEEIDVVSTRKTSDVSQRTHAGGIASLGLVLNHVGLTGGSNLFPGSIENPPYFKTGYSALVVTGTYNSAGQHVLEPHNLNCYGVGDCLMGSQFLESSGGFRDEADEGAHPFDLQIHEDGRVFQGSCSTGCTPGSTLIAVAVSSAQGTQGEGRFLINKNPAKDISTGVLTGSMFGPAGTPGPGATFSGTSFPVSVFLKTTQILASQATDIAPGTVTFPIATGGVPAGFATSTTALPSASGVACVADMPTGFNPTNYEMANYTAVDATHLQMTLNKVHGAGATIAVGGLCGYGVEQTVDTVGAVRQVFPVIGSYSPTGLYYAAHLTGILGVSGVTSSYMNVSRAIASISRSGNAVTLTMTGTSPVDLNGLTMTVSGVADSSFNGSFTVTSTGPSSVTYSQAGADGTSSGGSLGMVTGGFVLYPMAEVLGVFNTATNSVDGQLTLAPNTVAWGPNDAVEEPHYFQQSVQADTTYVSQTTPRPTTFQRAGVQYESNVGPGMRGWSVQNAVPGSSYLGSGGTHTAPDVAYESTGVWNRTMEAQAGEISVFQIHCNSHGCGRWNSGFNLFELDSVRGTEVVRYEPEAEQLNIAMGGINYGFSPQAFTAGTVNINSLNVTGTARMSGGTTVFGSGAAFLTGAQNEAYLQALSSGTNSAGVFVGRATPGSYASLDLVTGAVGNVGWSLQMQPNSTAISLLDRATGANVMNCQTGGGCSFPKGVTASNFNGILSGVTSSIGGAPLAAGACASGTVSVAGATPGVPVAVSASDGSLPSGTAMLSAAVTSAGTVTVQVCAVSASTPAAKTYNVRVLQ